MKRKITMLLLAAGSMFTMKSQVVFTENFTSPFNPATSGWLVQNLSNPIGTTSWAQGVGSNYPAFNGAPNDYFTANFNSASPNPPAGISNWLMTPVLTIYNGAVLEFATKTTFQGAGQPNFAPDRLQIRMSTAGTASTIAAPTTTNSVGSFTDLLLDINPLLGTSTASAVSNGSVNGYPNVWTVYTVQVTGVTNTVTGRFAFRYFVDDAGNGGTNSNNIGLDAVKYTLPCQPTVQSFTTCAGASTTLSAIGLPATTYSWDNGATTSSIVVSPASTTTYSLYPFANSLACGNVVTAVVTVSANLNVNVSAPSTTICEGEDITLTASGPATSYAWTTGATILGTGAVITVTPPTVGATTYSVGGLNGLCTGGNSIVITTIANPVVNITSASTLLCVSGPSVAVSFSASGAASYVWVLGSATATGSNVNVNIAAQTATTPAVSITTLGVIGVASSGCLSTDIFSLTVAKAPTIAATSSTANVCTNGTVNITATGAASYSFSGAGNSTSNPFTYTAGATAGASQFVITGTNAAGCSSTGAFTQNVVVCNVTTGIDGVSGYLETSVFPNPFTNELKINVLDGKVVVFNALGQVVINTPVHSSETINTSELPKGAYIVKAYNMNGELVKSVKVIKN